VYGSGWEKLVTGMMTVVLKEAEIEAILYFRIFVFIGLHMRMISVVIPASTLSALECGERPNSVRRAQGDRLSIVKLGSN